jgi:hypothetical protein
VYIPWHKSGVVRGWSVYSLHRHIPVMPFSAPSSNLLFAFVKKTRLPPLSSLEDKLIFQPACSISGDETQPQRVCVPDSCFETSLMAKRSLSLKRNSECTLIPPRGASRWMPAPMRPQDVGIALMLKSRAF